MRKAVAVLTGISFVAFLLGGMALESISTLPIILAGAGALGMLITGFYWRKYL